VAHAALYKEAHEVLLGVLRQLPTKTAVLGRLEAERKLLTKAVAADVGKMRAKLDVRFQGKALYCGEYSYIRICA
jgi:hypothetical protein